MRCKTASDSQLAPVVTELETAVKSQNTPGIMSMAKEYAAEFSTATFANLVGVGVLEHIKFFGA